MTTWTDIFPDLDGPPIKGDPSEFSTVASSFGSMHDDATTILEQFRKIMSDGGIDEIQGDVAAPFRNFVDDVSDRLSSLPEVSGAASKIFGNHATKLDGFQQAADAALAKAVTKWNECKTARTTLSTAKTNADNVQDQIDSSPPDADPSQLQGQHDDATGKVSSAQTNLTLLEGQLKEFRTKWDNLHDDERKLRDTTTDALGDLDLHSLKDPGWFDSFCEAACGFVEWAYKVTGLEDLVDLLDAAFHGDLARFLWALRGLLDKLITILSIVVLFTCPALFAVILVLAVLKLAVDVYLYASNTANPDTGERISLTDIAFDVLDVALAGKDFGGYKAAKAAGKPLTELAKARQLVDDGSRYLERSGQQLSRNQARSQEALLRRYHIEPTTLTINRGNRPAIRYVLPGSTTKFNLKLTEHALQDGHDVMNGVMQGGQAANDGPTNDDIRRTMNPDKSRPYFTLPSGGQMLNVMEIPLTR